MKDRVSDYLNVVVQMGLWTSEKNLARNMEFFFGGVELEGKNVLDIGGGAGLYSLYAASVGAKSVVCLEPEAIGSTAGVIQQFNDVQSRLNLHNVQMLPATFQEWSANEDRYDVIFLSNSINHLDEEACVGLRLSQESEVAYESIFSKLYDLANDGATIIVTDCSRYNAFASLPIRNPIARSIEWEKHQSPNVWGELLRRAGFVNQRTTWTSFNSLGRIGRIILGNRFAAYFLISHFRFVMDKR